MVISKRVMTKIGCLAVSASMVLSVAGCLGGKAKTEVIEAAESFAEAVKKGDPAKIIKLTTEKKDSDVAAGLTLILSEDTYTDEQNQFNSAVAKTIEAEVDEESVKVDGDSAEADIVFTIVDYEKALKDGEFEDIDGVLDAIKDCEDTKEITFSAEFEKDDDEWLISNLDDKDFGKIYDYLTYELPITASANFEEYLDYTDWYFDNGDNTYSHYNSYIELDLWFTSEIYDVDPTANFVYYEVYKDDGLVYTSDNVAVGGSTYIELIYGDDQGAALDNDGYIEAGEYEIIVYLTDGSVFTSSTCTVEEGTTIETTTYATGAIEPSNMFEFQDDAFEAKALEAGWWDYLGTMVGDGIYGLDTETIAFSIQVDPSETEGIHYEFYYSEDDDMTEEDMAEPAFAADIEPTVYPNGDTYYDIDYTPDEMVPGYYLLIVSDTTQETAYLFGACQVLDVTSSEY